MHSVAVAKQGSSLGLQQWQAPQLLHHLTSLSGYIHCSSRLLLSQQADCLAHEGMNERFCAHSIQAAQVCMRLRQ